MHLHDNRSGNLITAAKALGGTIAFATAFHIEGSKPIGMYVCFFIMASFLLYSLPMLSGNLQVKDFRTTGFYFLLFLGTLGYLDNSNLMVPFFPEISVGENLQNIFTKLWYFACRLGTVALSAWGGYHLLTAILVLIYRCLDILSERISQNGIVQKKKWLSVGIFACLWIFYFFMYLNQYPGSLSCDTPAQISQAITLQNFDNANPFINTAIVLACVQFAFAVGGDANTGIAIYTLLQFSLFAFAVAYAAYVALTKKLHWGVACLIGLWGLLPVIVLYAIGMWKDTFFAMFFLLTVVYIWHLWDVEHIKWKEKIVLFLLVLITSLARNSGWTSFLAIAIIIFLKKNPQYKHLAKVVLLGVINSVLIVTLLYPLMGISAGLSSVDVFPIPLQQVARVIANDLPLREEEVELIEKLAPLEEIKEQYDESIADSMKQLCYGNDEYMSAHKWEYLKLWVRVGLRYPGCYLEAYLAMTRNYWKIGETSWRIDNRIFENPYGIVRMPRYMKEIDLPGAYQWFLESSIPALLYVAYGSHTLWMIAILFGYTQVRRKEEGDLLVPGLVVYLGLMITSPVALFRYMIAPVLCTPIWFCIALYRSEKENAWNHGADPCTGNT